MSDAAIAAPQSTPVTMTFGRRVGIAAALFLSARAVLDTFQLPLQLLNIAVLAYRLAPPFESIVFIALNFAIVCAVILGTFFVLLRAQGCVARGERHWLASMPEPRLILLLTGLLLVSRIAPHLSWDSSLYANPERAFPPMYNYALSGLGFALAVAACYIWIWWCNCAPRVERLIVVAALAWAGFEFLLDLLDMVAPTLNVLVTRTHEEGWTFQLPGSDVFAIINVRSWIWRVSPEQILPSLGSWFLNVALTTPIAAIAGAALYRFVDRQSVPAPTP